MALSLSFCLEWTDSTPMKRMSHAECGVEMSLGFCGLWSQPLTTYLHVRERNKLSYFLLVYGWWFAVTWSKKILMAAAKYRTFSMLEKGHCSKKCMAFSGLDVFCSLMGITTKKSNIKSTLTEKSRVFTLTLFSRRFSYRHFTFRIQGIWKVMQKIVILK